MSLGFHATQSVGHAGCCALGDALSRACDMLSALLKVCCCSLGLGSWHVAVLAATAYMVSHTCECSPFGRCCLVTRAVPQCYECIMFCSHQLRMPHISCLHALICMCLLYCSSLLLEQHDCRSWCILSNCLHAQYAYMLQQVLGCSNRQHAVSMRRVTPWLAREHVADSDACQHAQRSLER